MPTPIDTDRLVLIVTGAHLRAESGDRPIAYRLRDAILDWAARSAPGETPFDTLVCSDVWWINNEELQTQPTISVGGPGVNALTAQLGEAVPAAFVIEDDLIVQVDLDFADPRAVVWGMNHAATLRAADAFVDRYMDLYLSAMAERLAG
ncbi:MAG: hypothetical protein D6693_06110 [Planctomycetota bacterium]|nr:MAG: hypothetical protein D6693_06110 [Planctomycetota bacterium]